MAHSKLEPEESWKLICEGMSPSLNQAMNVEQKNAEDERRLEESTKIGVYMRQLMMRYEELRGQVPGDVGAEFWDMVVISAGDQEQRAWYEAQLELKHESGELPRVQYLVVPDPPGPRIGSGGSTLHILTQLSDQYTEDQLEQWRILIIHAGGYSKRLPSHSCSGKIFSPLPVEATTGGCYQMLDLKLAMYLPFLNMMEAGVFVTASDDIEVYSMDEHMDLSEVRGECVTALAHPSSMYIGTTHGVYVMPATAALHTISPCLEVLQKPSVDLMRERGAVITLNNDDGETTETVYSDSAFWFHSQTSKKLMKLYQDLDCSLGTEVCIYGDFLTCLGERKTKHYIENLYKDKSDSRDQVVKKMLHEHVGDTRLNVLCLHLSKFYHLGTTQEYLQGLTCDPQLRVELNLTNIVSSRLSDGGNDITGIVLNCVIDQPIRVPHDSVVEYSIVRSEVVVGNKTILSNVEITDNVTVPPCFLYHTIPVLVNINSEPVRRYVTVAFHVTDDMKFSTSVSQAENLQFGGRLMEMLFSLSPQTWSRQSVFADSSSASLWSARMFSAHDSMSESFKHTVSMISALTSEVRLYSFIKS